MKDGSLLTADVVINNSDLVYAYKNLLPTNPFSDSLSSRAASCSSISFYWSLDRTIPSLETHNVFLADEYRESFDAIFKKHSIPDQPSFYVNIPSRIDPSAAPDGKDAMVILVPVGHLTSPSASVSSTDPTIAAPATATQDWPAMIALARKTILSTIKSRTGVDIAPFIVHEQTNDPITWQDNLNLDRGAILGLSHSFFNVLSFRPGTRARRYNTQKAKWIPSFLSSRQGLVSQIADLVLCATDSYENLYMVGASTHPGTGVPICLAGGKLVAEQVCADLGVRIPWSLTPAEARRRVQGLAGQTGRALDDIQGHDGLGAGIMDGSKWWKTVLVLFVLFVVPLFSTLMQKAISYR